MCSPATRGFWIDLLCRIHDSNKDGKLTANLRQMSQLCRCTEGEALVALQELRSTETADVYEESGVYTVTCRRLARKAELSKTRQQAGSKGAASTQAKREQTPNYNYNSSSDSEGSGLQRVREFCKSEGISNSDADWFYYKGEGNGWTNGGKPILDWKATLRSWKRAGYLPSQKQQTRNGQPQMNFKSRQDKINELNLRKAYLHRQEQTREVQKELSDIALKLSDL